MLDQDKLDRLRSLAAKALEKHEAHETIYVAVEREEVDPATFNRVLGPPLGVTDATWPRFEIVPASHGEYVEKDNRMEHVFTIDLRDVKLRGTFPEGARAASFFVSNRHLNTAYEQPNQECRLYFWGDADVARGFYEGTLPERKYGPGETEAFDLVAIEVPSAVFSSSASDDPLLEPLRTALFQCSARLGGEPLWMQGDPEEDDFGDDFGGSDDEDSGDEEDSDDEDSDDDEDSGDENSDDEDSSDEPKKPLIQDLGLRGAGGVVMQFDERFGDVNLGDSGIMYVYGDGTAFWQCG